jgi:alkanesulfonate monooxygenase SsuD/methylene tetrahydromethanopterin reductase-like flavin-dependent oxidoreductase (luciferase family)
MYQCGEPVVQERPRFVIGKEGQPMAEMGYVLSSEEMTPKEMVRNARLAEEAGFTTAWISDHYHPWIDAQGQSPFVWSVIGVSPAPQKVYVSALASPAQPYASTQR